jgi:hypothetical protein
MKQAIATYAITTKRMEGRTYESPRIYLPTKLTTDSAFPFNKTKALYVRVNGKKLVVERAPHRILHKFRPPRKTTPVRRKKTRKSGRARKKLVSRRKNGPKKR